MWKTIRGTWGLQANQKISRTGQNEYRIIYLNSLFYWPWVCELIWTKAVPPKGALKRVSETRLYPCITCMSGQLCFKLQLNTILYFYRRTHPQYFNIHVLFNWMQNPDCHWNSGNTQILHRAPTSCFQFVQVSLIKYWGADNILIWNPGNKPTVWHKNLTSCPTAQFGANAILGVSLAICKAGAAEKDTPLYRHIADLAGNTELVLPVPVRLTHSITH